MTEPTLGLLPSSFSEQFGAVDQAEGSEARSVLSPLAYLVDLLILAEGTGYYERRPDVRQIPLDAANTYTLVPDLRIANDVMGARSGDIRTPVFPAPLPFSEQILRLKTYAAQLGTSLEELWRAFASGAHGSLAGRLLLGLSEEEYALYSSPQTANAALAAFWGVSQAEIATLLAGPLALIQEKLAVSLKELKLLLRQDLSDEEWGLTSANPAERFFINQGSPIVLVGEGEPGAKIELASGAQLTVVHLDRMMRFVRLARRLELTFVELDWLLQTLPRASNGSVTLDASALQGLAVAFGLRKLGELEVDELCTLWGPVKSYGHGDGAVKSDLFSRVFDNGFPQSLDDLFPVSPTPPPSAEVIDQRLQATLRLSGADFSYLKATLTERGLAAPPVSWTRQAVVEYFTAYRRYVSLTSLLGLELRDLIALLDVIAEQWAVSRDFELEIPAPYSSPTEALDPHGALLGPDVPPHAALDVLQKLVSVKAWADRRQLASRQLAYICLADHAALRESLDDGSAIDDVQAHDAVQATLEELGQASLALLVPPSALQTGSLSENGAHAVFDALVSARVLETFTAIPGRALLRVTVTREELADAMQSGIEERLELHAGDLGALGFNDSETVFTALVARAYLEVISPATADDEPRYLVPAGLAAYFGNPENAGTFTLPSFQTQGDAVFQILAQHVDDASISVSAFAAAGVATEDLPLLVSSLVARSYLEPASSGYRVPEASKPFFRDAANVTRFALQDFSTLFGVLAGKIAAYARADANRSTEAEELAGRLAAVAEQHKRVWLRTLAGFSGLAEDLTEVAVGWAFGTPSESLEQTLATTAAAILGAQYGTPARDPQSDAFLASRFCRLQQLALLLRKTGMNADEARVFLKNQASHRALPETLKLPPGFLDAGRIDALTTLPNGNFLIVSGLKYAEFSGVDYRPHGTGNVEAIPGVTLTGAFRARVQASGLDAVFSDTNADGTPVLYLCAGDLYVSVDAMGTSAPKPIRDFGRVRNHIQDHARIDAAVQDATGKLFVFSGDQYVRYSQPQDLLVASTYVDERYPKSIRGKFEDEGLSALPAAMSSGVDAAFRDADGSYYFFAGNRYTHSSAPYELRSIRPVWGHVLNYLFEESRVDAAFVIGNATYLTRKNQLTRYTGPAYAIMDEGFPISFGNIAESEPALRVLRRFPNGLDAGLSGKDGILYAFKAGKFAASNDPDTSRDIRDFWGRVRNEFVTGQRVDGAFHYAGVSYLFTADQYVRYSGADYAFVDEGYPKRVQQNWNTVEHVGNLPAGLPLPITAVAIGRTSTGTVDDVYFFGGSQYAGPTGALADIKAHWARVRNNVQQSGVVDAAFLDGSGRMYLFSGDQFYRYTSPDQTFADETYPRKLTGNWALEGAGYSLPAAYANGISAALRAGDGRVFFFSGQTYARVDASPVATPRAIQNDWGVVRNWISSQNRVSAAFVDPNGKTYLFGGDQFIRYSTTNYALVDEGYPLAIGTRWGNLPQSFRNDIDAALVFRSPVDNVRRLYLFKDNSYVRYSTNDYTQIDAGYPKFLSSGVAAEGNWFRGFTNHDPIGFPPDFVPAIDATYVDTFGGQPRIFVFYTYFGTQWRREYRTGGWLPPVGMPFINDYLPFNRIDAAFVATDNTLHLFSGTQYASRPSGGSQTAPVDVNSRWALVQNRFAELGRVDACLSMADGRTYLFSNDQYLKYTGALRPGETAFYVDEGYPKKISPNFAGEGLGLSLVAQFQPTGYDLCRDATGKIHFFNGTRYDFSGNTGPDKLLSSVWGKVENHFQDLDRVDGAFRAENGKLYLFCDTQFIRYSAALEPGNTAFYVDEGYPRRVSVWWAGEGSSVAMPSVWNALGSAVLRDAQATYAFDGATYTSSTSSTPAPVIPTWARVRNEMQTQNRVDAGFVLGSGVNATTLLFSADQYVRYSDPYSGFVDEGYPKVIVHLAGADGVFPGIPSELLQGLRAFIAGTDGALHVFAPAPASDATPQLYVSSASGDTLRPLNLRWGIVDNQLWDTEFVDAALRTSDGKLFLFSGNQYLRYSSADRSNVDEGYPRKISTSYAAELGVPSFAPEMNAGVDAALLIGTTHFYFVGSNVISSAAPTTAVPLVARWGLVRNVLQESGHLDAAFVAPNGKLLLFSGNQYAVYSGASRTHVDEEFPRVIADDIGSAWPADFTQNLTAAAEFEGRSYLFQGSSHVRLSDYRLLHVDAGYPIANSDKFLDRFDFELGKLPLWWQAKQLFDDHADTTPTLLEYVDAEVASDQTSALARATQWPSDTITALLQIYTLTDADLLDLGTLAQLARALELAERVGSTPKKLKTEFWDRVFGVAPAPVSSLTQAADYLYQLIKAITSSQDFVTVARDLYNAVANAKRDALVAYLITHQIDNSALPAKLDANDVYEYLLTDVQKDASLDTSYIVEAINSIQLFYHRALMGLEPSVPEALVDNLRLWWPWMKNYRIWEANRKVFLHPENYIRPELRTEKSPAFEELEQKLLQDEITSTSVRAAYQHYLEAFHEIGRLRIVGGYRYEHLIELEGSSGGTSETATQISVFMIGVSRTEPLVYYFRFGALQPPKNGQDPDTTDIDWDPWQKVGITIGAARVQPVYAFNRLFLFWIESEPYNSTEFSSDSDKTYSASSEGTKQVQLTLKYSFYNFTKEWAAPQSVQLNPGDAANPDALPHVFSASIAKNVVVTARNEDPQGGGEEDFIDLRLRLLFWEWKLGKLTDALDSVLDPYQGFRYTGFSLIGDQETPFPPHLGIDPNDVTDTVAWGKHADSAPGEWFSFDAKGGTFLCRPSEAAPTVDPNTILGRSFAGETIKAAFAKGDDTFIFTQSNSSDASTLEYHHHTPNVGWRDPIAATDLAWPWALLGGVFQVDPAQRINAVIPAVQTSTTYFLLGSQYFTYSGSGYAAPLQFADGLISGSPDVADVLGPDVTEIVFADANAVGVTLQRAFKHPTVANTAVIVVQGGGGELYYVAIDVDGLRAESTSSDSSPFDGWDGLDTVFTLASPEPSVVFSRGATLVVFTWSSKAWSTIALPSGVTALSAAFLGFDDKLYWFADDQYAEVDPANLGAALTFSPVAARWGRNLASPFTRPGLSSLDGAVIGPDDVLYLFSGKSCLPCANFDPEALHGQFLTNSSGEPIIRLTSTLGAAPPEVPKVGDIWQGSTGQTTALTAVSSAFVANNQIWISGRGRTQFFWLGIEGPVVARYSLLNQERPFRADGVQSLLFLETDPPQLPTEFYARQFASQGQKYTITRLTSNTSDGFSRALFRGGIPALLSLATQQASEVPYFTPSPGGAAAPGRNELFVSEYVTEYPGKDQDVPGIDFSDANANAFYYWEIFFHVPFLIAQTLKQGQRFEDALHWYEYVFDPSEPQATNQYWKFLAFLDNDTFNREEDLTPLEPQIKAYKEDPFDPHAIAELRPLAYRKAFVMSYVDNLIAWGDQLFRQYTRESVGEATMLYVRAADILGRRPQELGKRKLTPTANYEDLEPLPNPIPISDEILQLENGVPTIEYESTWEVPRDPNETLFNPYFYIPENDEFVDYWNRVDDRLSKLRNGLNIDGIKQSLSLFAPPVDVRALVQAFASGGGLAQALADYNTPVPHQRFAFMLGHARELTSRLTSLGAALLSALEKKDAEELSQLRNTLERQILELQLDVKQQQLEGAKQSLLALQEGLKNAKARESHYQELIATGLSAYEQTQIAAMIIGQAFSQVANVFGMASSAASFAPQVGSPFALTYGGEQVGSGLQGLSQAFRAQGEMASFQSSLAATLGGWERRAQDWTLQKTLATGDSLQIGRQIRAAEIQVDVASQEVQIQRRSIKNNQTVDTFMTSKFTSKQLYQWMVGKLSSAYFQTYHLALGYAKAAQRAFQFELGLPEKDVNYIGSGYWDSLRKGLLAGEQLQLDLDRLEQAHLQANERRLEITRHVSLLQVNPLALLKLKQEGRAEFSLSEALFDSDFPGHYCRQIKTVALSFPAVVGPYHNFNATLTQLGHRALLTPDKKALAFLLGRAPDGYEPAAEQVRVDWRPNQQVALSTGVNDTGVFQVNYSDERYLPFEGTGAVSTWRLEVNGVDGPRHRETLTDVIITVQYTARQGGSAFAEVVKSTLGKQPLDKRGWLLNLAADYPDAWLAFMTNPATGISFELGLRDLPVSTKKPITGVYLHYELKTDAHDDLSREALALTVGSTSGGSIKPDKFVDKLSLPITGSGQNPAVWKLVPKASSAAKFKPENLRSIALVVTYDSKPTF